MPSGWGNAESKVPRRERLSDRRRVATIFVAILSPFVAFHVFGQTTKPRPSDGVQYVSPNGSNVNDGLSWRTAKASIQAALSALPVTGRHGGHGEVFLTGGNYTISSTIVIPSGTIVQGTAPGSHPVTIQASSSFPRNTPLISLGDRLGDEGVRLERVFVDCNNIPGAIGVRNVNSEENSGLTDVNIADCPGEGLDGTAQNSIYKNIVVTGGTRCTKCSASTIPIDVASHGIDGVTINFLSAAVKPNVGIIARGSSLSNAHCEGVVNCYAVSAAASLFSVNCGSSSTAGAVTNCVYVKRGANGFLVAEVYSTGHVTNVINDPDRDVKITNFSVPFYAVSPGPPGNQEIFASNNGVPFTAYSFKTNSGQSVMLAGQNGVSAGTLALSNGSGSRPFATPYRSAPVCTASDATRAAPVRVRSSRTNVSVSGDGNDIVTWICTPAAN